jgi:prefoldin subunit 5
MPSEETLRMEREQLESEIEDTKKTIQWLTQELSDRDAELEVLEKRLAEVSKEAAK